MNNPNSQLHSRKQICILHRVASGHVPYKDDFFSVPEDNQLEDFLQTVDEAANPDSDPEQAALAFICKRLKLNLKKLSEEEKKWLKKIAQKSDLLKNPNPQRGRK